MALNKSKGNIGADKINGLILDLKNRGYKLKLKDNLKRLL